MSKSRDNTAKTVEHIIYDWVRDNFGDSEAQDPSWNIRELAEAVARGMNGGYKPKYKVTYRVA